MFHIGFTHKISCICTKTRKRKQSQICHPRSTFGRLSERLPLCHPRSSVRKPPRSPAPLHSNGRGECLPRRSDPSGHLLCVRAGHRRRGCFGKDGTVCKGAVIAAQSEGHHSFQHMLPGHGFNPGGIQSMTGYAPSCLVSRGVHGG